MGPKQLRIFVRSFRLKIGNGTRSATVRSTEAGDCRNSLKRGSIKHESNHAFRTLADTRLCGGIAYMYLHHRRPFEPYCQIDISPARESGNDDRSHRFMAQEGVDTRQEAITALGNSSSCSRPRLPCLLSMLVFLNANGGLLTAYFGFCIVVARLLLINGGRDWRVFRDLLRNGRR